MFFKELKYVYSWGLLSQAMSDHVNKFSPISLSLPAYAAKVIENKIVLIHEILCSNYKIIIVNNNMLDKILSYNKFIALYNIPVWYHIISK